MKKLIKRFLLITGILFGLILIAGISIPFIYKDKIKARAMENINKNLDALVSVGDIDLTIFRTFPYLGVQFNEISVFGKKEFAGVPLFSANKLSLGFNIVSIIKGEKPLTIREIILDKPLINIQILENGKANYDISKDTSSKTANNEDIKMVLNKYQIINGTIVFNDKSTGIFIELKELDHTGSGDFSNDLFDLVTKTSCKSMTLANGNVTYLCKANVMYDATLSADLLNNKYSLKKNSLIINEIELLADGFVKLNEKDKEMDLNFSSPQNSFKNFLSLIPGAYTADFKDVKTEGNFKLKGMIKGKLSDTSIPSFDILVNINKGMVKYPTLPKSIKNIEANISIVNKGNQADQTVLSINPINLTIDSNPFEASIMLKTPVSDPDVDARFKGILNLADFAQAFPVKDLQELRGILNTDVTVKAKNSDIEKQRYENVNVSGHIIASNFAAKYRPYPAIQMDKGNIVFSPKNITLTDFAGKLGASDVQGSGRLDNFMAYFSPKLTMKGDFNLKSTFFNANEWLKAMESGNTSTTAKEPDATNSNHEVFERFDFGLKASIGKLLYENYEIDRINVDGNMKPNDLQVRNLDFNLGASDFHMSGSIRNIFNWMFKDQTLGGNIAYNSRFLDLNQFMQADPKKAATPENAEAIAIPKNIKMNVVTNIGKMNYTNMVLNNVKGTLIVADQAVNIVQGSAETMGGKMNISGGYNSKDIAKPGFNLKLNLIGISFQEAFSTMNTVKKLAPISQYISGKFNTDLNLSGSLTKEMSPDLNSLQADGFLETISAIVQNFKPLNEIGNKLNVKEFNNFELKNTKNWITIKNGAVELREFDYMFKNIAMKIGGKHSLTQDMDYKIKAKLPRKMLESNAVGSAAYSGIGFLSKEASKYGVNISAGEFVNVLIGIGGTMLSPKMSFKVLGTEGGSAKDQISTGINSAAASLKDSINRKAQDEIQKAKDKAKVQANKMADSLSKVANKKVDEAVKKTTDELKDKIGKEASEKLGDKVGDKAKTEIDKAKDKLKGYDPFKKKK